VTTIEKIDQLTEVADMLYRQNKDYAANIICVKLQELYKEAKVEKLKEENDKLQMHLLWASKLVGNQSMINEHACQKWHESYNVLLEDTKALTRQGVIKP
jgi:late competence protein required for DNA uptake (superfamily II DNA/RNA helicase)